MTDAKSAWNRAHEATREDERQRAMRALHDHIDSLEKENRELRSRRENFSRVVRGLENLVKRLRGAKR